MLGMREVGVCVLLPVQRMRVAGKGGFKVRAVGGCGVAVLRPCCAPRLCNRARERPLLPGLCLSLPSTCDCTRELASRQARTHARTQASKQVNKRPLAPPHRTHAKVLENNYRLKMMYSPDYKGVDTEQALAVRAGGPGGLGPAGRLAWVGPATR